MTAVAPAPPPELERLRETWAAAWPRALAHWSKYTKLSEPRWCFTPQEEKKAAKDAPKPNKYLSDMAAADSRRASAEGTPAVDGEAAVEEPLIKVTLKAKGHSDIKIKVRPVSVYPTSTLRMPRSLTDNTHRVQLL